MGYMLLISAEERYNTMAMWLTYLEMGLLCKRSKKLVERVANDPFKRCINTHIQPCFNRHAVEFLRSWKLIWFVCKNSKHTKEKSLYLAVRAEALISKALHGQCFCNRRTSETSRLTSNTESEHCNYNYRPFRFPLL